MEQLASHDKMLPTMMARVQSSAKTSAETVAVEEFVSKVSGLLSQAHTLQSCQRVLKTLSFAEIHRRQTFVPDAHARTFDWAFENEALGYTNWASKGNGTYTYRCSLSTSPLYHVTLLETRASRTALMEIKGIFWITGKPGCGKSTLMKHLSRHPQTMELLRVWAGDNELILAHHYFWIAGTSLQKSRIGLLRTLLVHTLQQSPELVLELLPERFRKGYCHRTIPPWTQEELIETIKAIGKQSKHEARLCIFVDGLDEYEGEHTDLIDLLSTLAENPHIKLCISSRPWNVFTRAYRNRVDGELAVQDLTKLDIETYIKDKMLANSIYTKLQSQYPKECGTLIDKITERAEGVFLWIFLVVRSLLRGLGNDDDLETLTRRLEEYPRDLDGYFQRMFDRIESVYSKQSARLMLASLSAEKALPFWAPRCIEWETKTPDYASSIQVSEDQCFGHLVFGPGCPNLNDVDALHVCHDPWRHHTLQQETDLTRYVDARCADLLELKDKRISFIHRTARDFLRRIVLTTNLTLVAGADYDVSISLARLHQAGLKKLWNKSFPMDLVDELRSFETLIKPANMQLYASIFDDLEEQGKMQGQYISLIRPPIVRHLKEVSVMAECGFAPSTADECDDFETLFGGS